MLGNFELECLVCYNVNVIQLNRSTGVLKCKECGSLYKDVNIHIVEGKAVEVKLEPIGGVLYE